MQYDPETNILAWEIDKKSPIDHCLELGNFIVHLSKAQKPVLIEILDASKFIGQEGIAKSWKSFKKIIPEAN